MNKLFKMIYFICSILVLHSTSFAKIEIPESDSLRALLAEQKIIANALDAGSNQRFGHAVSISGNRVVVGAINDSLNGTASGSAFVFEFIGNQWMQTQKLNSDDAATSDEFGSSVSIDQERILIGARSKEIDGLPFAGAIYVFDLINGVWQQTQRLSPNMPMGGAQFGYSVSLFNDKALIGAPSIGSGQVYVFTLDDKSLEWYQSNTLTANDGGFGDRFGHSVSLYQGHGLVGANKSQMANTGAAYYFESLSGNPQQEKLTASDGVDGDEFGISVSLFEDRALVGSPEHDGVSGNKSGAVYVFDFKTGNDVWQETEKLIANDAAAGDEFGNAVSLNADKVLIGSWGDDDDGSNSGSAYFFEFDGDFWNQTDKLTPSDGLSAKEYGRSVFLTGNWASVGAPRDAENGSQAGAAYVYQEDIIFVNGFNE